MVTSAIMNVWLGESAGMNHKLMAFRIFGRNKKTIETTVRYCCGKKQVVYHFILKKEKYRMVVDSGIEKGTVLITLYNPLVKQKFDVAYSEKYFTIELKELIDVMEGNDMTFYGTLDILVSRKMGKLKMLKDIDLYRMVAEIILVMKAISWKNYLSFPDEDQKEIAELYVKRMFSMYSERICVSW